MLKNAEKCAYSRYRRRPYSRERAAENFHYFILSFQFDLENLSYFYGIFQEELYEAFLHESYSFPFGKSRND